MYAMRVILAAVGLAPASSTGKGDGGGAVALLFDEKPAAMVLP